MQTLRQRIDAQLDARELRSLGACDWLALIHVYAHMRREQLDLAYLADPLRPTEAAALASIYADAVAVSRFTPLDRSQIYDLLIP